MARLSPAGSEHSPVDGAAVIGALVARPWRSMRKYGPRGMRLTLHESGAMSQQLHLAATALGLAGTDWSGFYDVPANPDEVELRTGVWNTSSHVISDDSGSGRLLSLVTALDGTATASDVADRCGATTDEVARLLDHLRELGAVEDGPQSALDHYLDVHAHVLRGPDPGPPPTVRLLGDPDSIGPLAQQLAASDPKLAVLDATDETAHQLLDDPDTSWADDPLRRAERLAPAPGRAVGARRGRRAVPVRRPGVPARADRVLRVLRDQGADEPDRRGLVPAVQERARGGRGVGRAPTWETTVSEVLPVPGCPECGPVSQREDASLYFDVRAWLDAR